MRNVNWFTAGVELRYGNLWSSEINVHSFRQMAQVKMQAIWNCFAINLQTGIEEGHIIIVSDGLYEGHRDQES